MINTIISYIIQLPFIVLILISTGGILLGDYFAKLYSLNQNSIYFWLCLIGYIICGIFFIASLFKEDLVYATIFLEVIYLVGMLIMGFFLFGETFTKMQYIGMLFAIIGIVILIFNE